MTSTPLLLGPWMEAFETATDVSEVESRFVDALPLFKGKVPHADWCSGWAVKNSYPFLMEVGAWKGLDAVCTFATHRDDMNGVFNRIEQILAWQQICALDSLEACQVFHRHGFGLSEQDALPLILQNASSKLLSTLNHSAWQEWNWVNWDIVGPGALTANPKRHEAWVNQLWPHVALGLASQDQNQPMVIHSVNWAARVAVGVATTLQALDLLSTNDTAMEEEWLSNWAVNWGMWTKRLAIQSRLGDMWEIANKLHPDVAEVLFRLRQRVERETLIQRICPEVSRLVAQGVAL
jgi:hypothetical protein